MFYYKKDMLSLQKLQVYVPFNAGCKKYFKKTSYGSEGT